MNESRSFNSLEQAILEFKNFISLKFGLTVLLACKQY